VEADPAFGLQPDRQQQQRLVEHVEMNFSTQIVMISGIQISSP